MFNFGKNAEPNLLELEIIRLHESLTDLPPESKEYAATVDQLLKLAKHKEETTSKRRVSTDTLVVAGANLLGIAMIIGHERVNVITTKAIGFVMKAR